MELSNWLRYWRNSLLDIDRRQPEVTDPHAAYQPTIETEVLRKFYTQHCSTPLVDDEPLDIVLAPFHLALASENHRTNRSRRVYPFWVPARLTPAGELLPPAADDGLVPWLVRDVLEPAAYQFPVLSTLEATDAALLQWRQPVTLSWSAYWANAQAYYAQATGTPGWPKHETVIGDWWVQQAITLALPPTQGTAASLIDLYGYLEKRATLPPLLTALLRGQSISSPFDPESAAQLYLKGHYGQLSSLFPLSTSQRGTLQTWLATKQGEVLPVNGPPGTGKTTLLQSIVANLIVEKALLGEDAPRILASSTNNQAITNILDSFGREASVVRWVPAVTSLGLYLTNRPADTSTAAYQLHGRRSSFFQTKEAADGQYLQTAQAELLRHGSTFFGKSFTTPAALRDELHQALKQQVARIDSWLDLLPKLRDERGQPWQAAQLHHEAAATRTHIAELEAYQVELARLQASESGLTVFLSRFITAVRQRRQARYLLLVREHCPYRDTVTEYDPGQLQLVAAQRLAAAQAALRRLQTALTSLATFDQLAARLRQEFNQQPSASKFLAELSAADTSSVHNALDVTLRHQAFLLALHYWESRYVVALRDKIFPAQPPRSPHERRTLQYARWAMLTPCFISTCHSVPRFLRVKERTGEDGYALEYFDLLLVDEAGQVSPEVGAAVFSLARRAVVVGDIHQIEPVWGISPALDAQNQRRMGIALDNCPEAYRVSAGSLMRLAQAATSIQLRHYPQARGLLLRQHRRCKPEIIRYCDEFVYGGQLERLGNPTAFASLGLPPLGYVHIAGECIGAGSRSNPEEAEAIARWLALKKPELLAAAQRQVATGSPAARLQDIVAVVTPFSAQRSTISRALQTVGLGNENITVGTVHALQGAERPIILFSPVYDARHQGSYFFDRGYNLLNVAVSRAKEAFIVIGNRCLFNPSLNTPSGNLAKLLLAEPADTKQPSPELDNSFFYGDENRRHLPVPREQLAAVAAGKVNRLSTLRQHCDALIWAINTAERHLVIVSPFISVRALQADKLPDLIKAAKLQRPSLRVTVYTDAYLDAPDGRLHTYTQAGRAALAQAGADVRIAAQIHNKTICVDDQVLLEGSFNWLSASRNETLARHEVSWFFRGPSWADYIGELVQEMESRVIQAAVV
ncbi:AAA domain-containing protein [Hymenobacter pini]|uniref:AAA domain-containing protein n=1 Tax=Hymenobacter pini TaxID=2880879 RepID=UPI001CF5350F|nr:AAA domain-containing protein [Hymenobacter pini]MCA8833310.1 AAA domain-containing protein [Hymenobacter pini]